MEANQSPPGQQDLLGATEERDYKCARCGNMFPVGQTMCEVCGLDCRESACQIVHASDEGF